MRCADPLTRRTVLTVALAATLAGCGFHLRTPQALNYERIGLSGFPDRSTMADEIRRALPATARIVPSVLEAQVVIEALIDTRETTVEASTAFGQVREMQLHVRLRYRVLRPDGTVLLAPTEVERFRDLTYDEKDALAKDTELNALYRDMQSDIAVQIVRVLAALGKPGGEAARIGASLAASSALAPARVAPEAPAASGTWGAPAASAAAR